MRVFLHEIAKSEDGSINLSISIGRQSPRNYCTSNDHPKGLDGDLYAALFELSEERFGDKVVYHVELDGIVDAFLNGQKLPDLPAEFGKTAFCTRRPGFLKIAMHQMRMLTYKIGISRPYIVAPPYHETGERLVPARKRQRRRISVEEAESAHSPNEQDPERLRRFPELKKPFGFQNNKWEELKNLMEPEDELWEYCSDRRSWKQCMGTEGIVLVRNGRVIALIVTLYN